MPPSGNRWMKSTRPWASLPLIHKDRFSDADYAALATTINQKVGYAIEHCKLDAKADAMLHLSSAN